MHMQTYCDQCPIGVKLGLPQIQGWIHQKWPLHMKMEKEKPLKEMKCRKKATPFHC